MAIIGAVRTALETFGDNARIVSWPNMASGDEGSSFESAGLADRSVQVTGTFGSGGNLKIKGSNDGVNFAMLTDPQGNDLDFTTAKIEAITEIVRYIKPVVSAGDGSTSLTVTMIVKGK